MPRREKQGDEWFSHKVTDEHGQVHYCRGYASKNGTGWGAEACAGTNGNATVPPPARPDPKTEIIAAPVETDHGRFYEAATAALNAGKIQFDKFNALVSKANRHGYAAALEELQGIV